MLTGLGVLLHNSQCCSASLAHARPTMFYIPLVNRYICSHSRSVGQKHKPSHVLQSTATLDQIRPLQINFLFPVHRPHPQAGVGVAPLFGFYRPINGSLCPLCDHALRANIAYSVTTCDACAADHMVRFTRPSPSIFAYCKRSKTGTREGLGMRLIPTTVTDIQSSAKEIGSLK